MPGRPKDTIYCCISLYFHKYFTANLNISYIIFNISQLPWVFTILPIFPILLSFFNAIIKLNVNWLLPVLVISLVNHESYNYLKLHSLYVEFYPWFVIVHLCTNLLNQSCFEVWKIMQNMRSPILTLSYLPHRTWVGDSILWTYLCRILLLTSFSRSFETSVKVGSRKRQILLKNCRTNVIDKMIF